MKSDYDKKLIEKSDDSFKLDIKEIVDETIWSNPNLDEIKKTMKALAKK